MNIAELLPEMTACDAFVHINCGMAVYVFAKFQFRTRRASIYALYTVAACAVILALSEGLFLSRGYSMSTLFCLIMTLFWPALEYLVSLYRRQRWQIDQISRELRQRRTQQSDMVSDVDLIRSR